MKLTGVTRNNDGFQTREIDGVELGDDNNVGGSLQARWLASENLDITFATDVTRRRAHIAAHGATTVVASGGSALYESVTGVNPVDFQPAADPWEKGTAGIRPSDDLDVFGASFTVSYDLGESELKSITAYREMEADTGTDFDGTPIPYNDQLVNQDQEQFSQEFQLSKQSDRYQWVLGAYYLQEDILEEIQNNFYLFYAFNGAPVGDGPLIRTDLSTESVSVFGQLTYHLTDKLSATAGLRWTRETKEVDILSPFGLASGGQPVMVNGDKSWENVSPRLGVEYQVDNDLMLYASATRGFKSGSFNGRPDRNNDFDPYAPEKVWAYEVGFKSEFMDNRVRFNGAAFVTDYDGIQLVTGGLDSNGVPFFPVDNAGDVRIMGAELELTARPVEALNIFAAAGYTEEDWQEIYPIAFVTDSTRLPMMSHGTFILGGDYRLPLGGFGSLVLGANYSYRSSFFMDTNNSPRVEQDGYGLLDARVILKPENGNWELKFWGKNLTDEEYITWAQDLIPIFDSHTVSFFGRPREYGVTFSMNF